MEVGTLGNIIDEILDRTIVGHTAPIIIVLKDMLLQSPTRIMYSGTVYPQVI